MLNILVRDKDYIKTFRSIVDRFTLNAEIFSLVKQVVCGLCELSKCSSTNEACYKKFCSKKKSSEPQLSTMRYVLFEESKLCKSKNPKITDPLSCCILLMWGLRLDNQGWFASDPMDAAEASSQWINWVDILHSL